MADTPAETAAPQPAEAPAGRLSQEEVEEALKNVIDPELGVNIVDLGLLYGSKWAEDGALVLDMTLTTAAVVSSPAARALGAAL
jgi:metal-sulfur cluster biosynthetic enzyme